MYGFAIESYCKCSPFHPPTPYTDYGLSAPDYGFFSAHKKASRRNGKSGTSGSPINHS